MLTTRPAALPQSESAPTQLSKTPGRTLKGRAGLQENVLQHGSKTANPKEKRVALNTPFRRENPGQYELTVPPLPVLRAVCLLVRKDAPSALKPSVSLGSRLLADKTPLPNRHNNAAFVTPAPNALKISKLPLTSLVYDAGQTETPLQPPSTSRKKLRIPRSASKSFETPVTKGDHWNVSDVSIDVDGLNLDEVKEDDTNEPDYSDPEYMPPTAIGESGARTRPLAGLIEGQSVVERPYEPPFELPDYRVLGQQIFELSHSFPVGDEPTLRDDIDDEELLKGGGWTPGPSSYGLHVPEPGKRAPQQSISSLSISLQRTTTHSLCT